MTDNDRPVNPEQPQEVPPPEVPQPEQSEPAQGYQPQPAQPEPSPWRQEPAQGYEPQLARPEPTPWQPEPAQSQQPEPAQSQQPQPAQPEPPSWQPSEPQYTAPRPPAAPQPAWHEGHYQGYSFGPPPQSTAPFEPLPPSATAYGPYQAPEAPTTQPPRHRNNARTTLVAAALAALIGGGVGAGVVAAFDHDSTNVVSLSATTQTAPPTAKIDGSISGAAAKIQPSVVTINVTGQQESGTGSGVIIRSDGYILTNAHVVSVGQGGGSIQVVLDDGTTTSATVVGVDASDDLAVVKINKTGLTAATFASSSKLIVGQTVVAVGAPLGLSDTVTSGIVSNTARPVRAGANDQAVFNAIQTDAAINPGNSGGPLVDLNGNVVGINAAIATTSSGGLQVPNAQSGSIGIGFAIPSDEASRIASELIATGKASHALLGVQVQNSASGQSTVSMGATVHEVTPGGAAAKAGIAVGDVITKVDNQRITDADSLIAAVRSHPPNSKVTITFTHGGQTKTVEVTLGSSTS